MFGKLLRLLSRYPRDPAVHPDSFTGLKTEASIQEHHGTIAFQSVPDKFYFLIFGAIVAHLKHRLSHLRAELVVVRSVSGGVGSGCYAELKRAAEYGR